MQRQRRRARFGAIELGHMIGMRHLQPAVVGLELAGDQPPASLRQQALEIGGVGIEIDELERGPGLILDQHAVGTEAAAAPSPAAARPMLGHRDFERGKLADLSVGYAWRDGAVDHRDRQMPQEVDHARMPALVARRQQLVQQPLDLGPHALQGAHRGEQRR